MATAIHVEDRTVPLPRPAEDGPVATEGRTVSLARRIAAWASALGVPALAGVGVGALMRSRKAGLIAGGVTAVAVAAIRSQLERWFTAEPDYDVHRWIGPLELRLYTPRIEARTKVDATSFEQALDQGFRRLASYIHGANATHEQLEMVAPVITSHDGAYTVAFVMPAGRTIDTLPHPSNDRVRLHHVPERRIAVLRFPGRHTDQRVADQERELLRHVADAGLRAVGLPMVSCFDPPWTLPFLRRNEAWIELGL